MKEIITITGLNKDGFFYSLILFSLILTIGIWNNDISPHLLNSLWLLFIMINLLIWTFSFKGTKEK